IWGASSHGKPPCPLPLLRERISPLWSERVASGAPIAPVRPNRPANVPEPARRNRLGAMKSLRSILLAASIGAVAPAAAHAQDASWNYPYGTFSSDSAAWNN